MARSKLTHVDETGSARMVDVGEKSTTRREATAECLVRMAPATVAAVRDASLAKGDALQVARVAAIMAAKRTPELIPLCHPLPITAVDVDFDVREDGVRVEVTVRVTGQTGVEMEALTAVAVAGLALHDMIKAVDPAAVLDAVRVERKEGGKTGTWVRQP